VRVHANKLNNIEASADNWTILTSGRDSSIRYYFHSFIELFLRSEAMGLSKAWIERMPSPHTCDQGILKSLLHWIQHKRAFLQFGEADYIRSVIFVTFIYFLLLIYWCHRFWRFSYLHLWCWEWWGEKESWNEPFNSESTYSSSSEASQQHFFAVHFVFHRQFQRHHVVPCKKWCVC
jgi:hypothetical protein